MKKELIRSNNKAKGLVLDPRTKLLLLVMIATFVLGGAGNENMEIFQILLSGVPLLLLLISGNRKACTAYVVIYTIGYFAQFYLLPMTTGTFNFLVLAINGMLTRFLPSIMMGIYAMTTTTVSEFVAAMERMRVSNKITIPMSVMFRFFPTVGEEYTSIKNAMSMRGIKFGSGKPSKMVEYRLIPMMTCSVKIGEELSAAALTRGLGSPVKRTNICNIGFHIQDIVIFLLCFIVIVFWVFGWLGIL